MDIGREVSLSYTTCISYCSCKLQVDLEGQAHIRTEDFSNSIFTDYQAGQWKEKAP